MRKCHNGREIDGKCLKTYKSFNEMEADDIQGMGDYGNKYMKDITFDYAKLQDWLNDFVKRHNLDYDEVRVSMVWVYPKSDLFKYSGYPFSMLEKINEHIYEDFMFEQHYEFEKRRN